MPDLLDGPGLPEVVQRHKDAAGEIHPELPVALRVQPLLAHGPHGHVIGADGPFLPQHVVTAARDLVAAEVGRSFGDAALRWDIGWFQPIELEYRIDVEQIGRQPVYLALQLGNLAGSGGALFLERGYDVGFGHASILARSGKAGVPIWWRLRHNTAFPRY